MLTWPEVRTPAEAKAKIEAERAKVAVENPKNLEEQALSLGGKEIYEIFVKGYTQKQWGRPCTELPAFILHMIITISMMIIREFLLVVIHKL